MKEQYSVSTGGRTITKLTEQKRELVKLVYHVEEASKAYGMKISAENTQLMTNNTNEMREKSRT